MSSKIAPSSFFHSLSTSLFKPLDISSLVFFRIAFGTILFWEVFRYLEHGWIKEYWIKPTFLFKYYGFGWIHPWPGDGMYIHFAVLGVLSIFIAIGFLYRVSAALFFLGFTYVFLLDQTRYLNHFYLICLISFLMIFVPSNRKFSVDAGLFKKIRSETAPAWALWLLRVQIGIVYFYSGLAKMNGDWLHGQPMRMWLLARSNYFLVGHFFTQDWVVYLFSYGALLFDLLIFPLLLWNRTRIYVFGFVLYFHLMNSWLFDIGVFPWFMIAATLLFFPPDWPRRVFIKLGLSSEAIIDKPEQPGNKRFLPVQLATLILLGVYILFQLLMPLRHFMYPGEVSWTEEGFYFSWHMMLRSKAAVGKFFAVDPASKRTSEIDLSQFLTPRQIKWVLKNPDMILQLSHHLEDYMLARGYEGVEIRAKILASLNFRRPQYLVDPTVNLASQPRTMFPSKWILQLMWPVPVSIEEVKSNFPNLPTRLPNFDD
jgi:HTTM domain/Vitamin K-dependent gamma-carboxylase, lumenal domain